MRRLLSTLLALLACLLLPLALVAGWLVAVGDDRDRYVGTVGPLAEDPRVLAAVERSLTDRTLGSLAGLPLVGDADLEQVVGDGVRVAVEGDAFRPVWEAANADAHTQLLAQLRGAGSDEDVVLDLGSLVDAVVVELEQALGIGFPEAGVGGVEIVLLQGERVSQARAGYEVLTVAGLWLPMVNAVLAVLAIVLSPRRPRVLALLGLGGAATLALLLVALDRARDRVVAEAPGSDRALASALWDGVTTSLDRTVHAGLGVCVALVVLAVLGGLFRGARTA